MTPTLQTTALLAGVGLLAVVAVAAVCVRQDSDGPAGCILLVVAMVAVLLVTAGLGGRA